MSATPAAPAVPPLPGGPRRRRADPLRAQTLYAELSAEVRAAGLMTRRHGYYAVLGGSITLGLLATVVGIVVIGDSWWVLTLAPVVAILVTQAAFLGHDAAHHQVLASGRGSAWLTRLVAGCLVGMSYGWWQAKHSRHHRAPNQVGKDPDIDPAPVAWTGEIANARRGTARWFTRRQGWWFWPLLLVVGLSLHVSGYKALLSWPGIRHRRLELAIITGRLAAGTALLFAVMSPAKALVFLVVHLAVFGVYLGGSFAPNHIGMPVVDAHVELDFLRRQVLTSRNVRGGAWLDLAMGGLNLQVEHHLFPGLPRPALRRAVPLVRAACERHGVAYTEQTLPQSFAAVTRYLAEVGLGGGPVITCPMVQQLRPLAASAIGTAAAR